MAQSGKFEGIQALRGISVLFTVFAHLPATTAPFAAFGLRAPWLIGVAIFYGISGWIIAHVTSRNSGGDIAPFLTKRLFRLVPVLLVSVMMTLVASVLLPHNPVVDQFYPPPPVAWHAGMSCLFFFADLGYWISVPYAYSLEGLWSVSVEVKFYVVYALLLIVSPRLRSVSLGVLAAAILAFRCYLVQRGYMPALSHVFFVELFCLGGISYRFHRQFRFHPLVTAAAWSWIMAFVVLDLQGTAFMFGYVALVLSIIYVVNWAASAGAHYGARTDQRFFIWLGERSYVLYVFHFQFLAIAGLIGQIYYVNYRSAFWYNVILVAGLLLGMLVVELLHRTVEPWGIRTGAIIARSIGPRPQPVLAPAVTD